jgi:Tol biopolymer transport system component
MIARLAVTGCVILLVLIVSARAGGALLSEGGQIAFQSSRDGDADIWLVDVSRGLLHNLTANNPDFDGSPSWSPDGRSLAFDSVRRRDGQRQVYVTDHLGRGVRLLVDLPGSQPSWSPEGTHIAFYSSATLLADVQSGEVRPLPPNALPQWTQTGLRVLLVNSRAAPPAQADEYSDYERLENISFFNTATWAADRQRVAMAWEQDGDMGLFTLDVSCMPQCDGAMRSVPNSNGGVQPTWSPDGRWLAYLCPHTRAGQMGSEGELCIIQPDGSGRRVLTRSPRNAFNSAPAWRP